jgi:hypothetical protein
MVCRENGLPVEMDAQHLGIFRFECWTIEVAPAIDKDLRRIPPVD